MEVFLVNVLVLANLCCLNFGCWFLVFGFSSLRLSVCDFFGLRILRLGYPIFISNCIELHCDMRIAVTIVVTGVFPAWAC